MDKTRRAFIGLNIAIILASLLLGTTLAVKYKSLNSQAAISGSCSGHGSASSCQGSCSPNGYKCTWRSATGRCNESAIECGSSGGGSGTGTNNTQTSCENGNGHWCDGVYDVDNRQIPAFCVSNSAGITCGQQANNLGYVVRTGGGGGGSGGFRCVVGQRNYTGGSCVEYNSVENLGQGRPPACFCGTIQIDGGEYDGTYVSTCGCNNNENNTNPTPSPTPSPSPTPTKSPSPTPSPTPTKTPTMTPTATPTKSPSPTPTATPILQCNSSCTHTSQCVSGQICYKPWGFGSGNCRNIECKKESDCICKTPTPTPTSTPTVTATPTGEPNYCGGTCGSNSNCQGEYFCYQGFCRNPQCAQEADCSCKGTSTPPPVLGQTAPPVLPKTGGSAVAQVSLFGIVALGVYLFKKFRLI